MYVKCLKKREIKRIHLKKASLHVLHMISVVTPDTDMKDSHNKLTDCLERAVTRIHLNLTCTNVKMKFD